MLLSINDYSDVESAFSMVIGLMSDFVDLLKSIEIFNGASLFTVLIAISVIAIILTYVVNTARRAPDYFNTSSDKSDKSKGE